MSVAVVETEAVRADISEGARTEPRGPKGYPLVGLLPKIWSDPLRYFVDIARVYGDVIPLQLGPERIFMLNHPDHIKRVFQDNHENYRKSDYYEKLRPILGEGIFMSRGEAWLNQRRTAQPAFQGARFAAMAAKITDATEQMLERWRGYAESGRSFDAGTEMMWVTLDVIVRTMFSITPGDRANAVYEALTVVLRQAEKRVWSLTNLPEYIPTRSNREFKKALAALDSIVLEIIEQRRRDTAEYDDLLAMLMSAYDAPSDGPPNHRLLRDQVMSILLAGHETTANALTWTLYLLSKNPTVEGRVLGELQTVLGGRTPTFQDLSKLTYTTMVFNEAMRLYPPVWTLSRTAIEDDRMGDVSIAAGTTVMLCAYSVHRNPRYWDNPEDFDPERFTEERVAERHRYAHFPFGGGPRVCMGQRFALMEAQLIVAMLLPRYRVDPAPGHVVEPEPMITLRPRGGLPVTIRDRQAG
jgi:cytochrome P450